MRTLNNQILNSLVLKKAATVFLLLNAFYSCDFSDTNVDPTKPNDVELHHLLPALLTQGASNVVDTPFNMLAIIMQQLEGKDRTDLQINNYNIDNTFFNYDWGESFYSGVLKDCAVVIEKSEQEDQPHYKGIALIMMADAYGMLTSGFGDIPYSDALRGAASFNPFFDRQQDVYDGIQKLLDEAIMLLREPQRPIYPNEDDLIFKGQADAWVMTAYALKARYHLHLTKRNTNAFQLVLDALDSSFTSNDLQPDFQWIDNANGKNPLATPNRISSVIAAPFFEQLLSSKNDPRKDSYMQFSGNNYTIFSLHWTRNEAKIPLISYSELKFIESEALLMTNASDAIVESALQEAIISNMEILNISSLDYMTYVQNYSSLAGLTQNQKLQWIIEEAYSALYLQNNWAIWSNYRRTGFPILVPNPQGSNALNPSGVIPRRITYPESEQLNNSSNLNNAIERQGCALLDCDLWAFAN